MAVGTGFLGTFAGGRELVLEGREGNDELLLVSAARLELAVFDACLLASIEMAYTLASCADYMVASEETITSIASNEPDAS